MPRAGRDLETLVALVEQLLEGQPVQVRSPEFIVGRNSGIEREVDVTLRAGVGSAEILVMIECRDRDTTQGVEWIDQIVGKRNDVQADRAIVVSSSSFSAGAVTAARSVGIDLRQMNDLSEQDVLEWVSPSLTTVEMYLRKAHLNQMSLVLATGQPDPAEPVRMGPIRRMSDGVEVAPLDLWQHNLNETASEALWGPLEPGQRVRRPVRLNFTNKADRYEVSLSGDWFDVEGIECDVEVWIEIERAPARQFRYSADGRIISEGFTFTYSHPDRGEHAVVIASETADDGGRVIGMTQRRLNQDRSDVL